MDTSNDSSTEWLQATKNGACTSTWYSTKNSWALANGRHRKQNKIFPCAKLCVYGGTGKACPTTHCLIGTKQWMRNLKFNKCNDSTMLSSKNDLDRWHSVILQHDNTCPHIANITKEAIQTLSCKLLPHTLYSPDLAPSNFHLFRSLSNALRGVSFHNDVELQVWLDDFFRVEIGYFYRRGTDQLVQRWEEVVNNHGEYITNWGAVHFLLFWKPQKKKPRTYGPTQSKIFMLV